MAATPSVHTPEAHTSDSEVSLCSLRFLCETNIHHSVRKKQSKFCLKSVDKKIFVNIRVIRGQIASRGGFYRTQIARIFTDSFFYLTQITRIAQRLRRKECSQHGSYAECTRLVGFQ